MQEESDYSQGYHCSRRKKVHTLWQMFPGLYYRIPRAENDSRYSTREKGQSWDGKIKLEFRIECLKSKNMDIIIDLQIIDSSGQFLSKRRDVLRQNELKFFFKAVYQASIVLDIYDQAGANIFSISLYLYTSQLNIECYVKYLDET